MGKHHKNNIFKKIKKYRRLIILILIIICIICFIIFLFKNNKIVNTNSNEVNNQTTNIDNTTSNTANDNTVIEIYANTSYEELPPKTILGQTIIQDADGYTTTFSPLHGEEKKEYIEYKQNLGSWAENSYWGGTMEENGCGITSIAIIASGYGSNVTPEDLRQKYYPHLDAKDIEYSLEQLGIECTEFYFSSAHINIKYISSWLKTGRPILVCLDNSKENIWTAASHYMVLLDVDEDGNLYVSNPNGEDESEKASGWYSPDEVIPYIAKALFIESY